jgi:hypothetical protein
MSWSHRQTQIDKRPAQVLIDDRFRSSTPVRQLPRLAWFGVYCRQDVSDGFWHPDETASLDAIEQDLIRLCGQLGNGWAVYVMRIDTRGVREYYFYFDGNAELGQVPAGLRAAHPNYRIDYDEMADAEWSRYKTVLSDYKPVA